MLFTANVSGTPEETYRKAKRKRMTLEVHVTCHTCILMYANRRGATEDSGRLTCPPKSVPHLELGFGHFLSSL